MKILLFVLFLNLSLLGTSALRAEETAPDGGKPTETKNGVLSEKPGNAGEGVVAVLTVRPPPQPHAKGEKKKAAESEAPAGEKINLIASGDLATRIIDLSKKGATVDVSGVLDGVSMKVTQVVETAEGTTMPKKKKNPK